MFLYLNIMQVSTIVDAEYPYNEQFQINISAFHDDFTQCLNWSSISTFRTQTFETLPTAILNRYPKFFADKVGAHSIRTIAKCECAAADGEVEIVEDTDIIRTQLGITSAPSYCKIYFGEGNDVPGHLKLVTPEVIELGIITEIFGHVILKRAGYVDKDVTVSLVKGSKTEHHIVMVHL